MANFFSDWEIFTVELSSGKTVTASVDVEGYIDSKWGADADGCRGVRKLFINNAEVVSPLLEDNNEHLTDEDKLEASVKLCDAAHDHEWDF